MENVHLAPEEEEDDLYTGYNDYNPTFDSEVNTNLNSSLEFIEKLLLLLYVHIIS